MALGCRVALLWGLNLRGTRERKHYMFDLMVSVCLPLLLVGRSVSIGDIPRMVSRPWYDAVCLVIVIHNQHHIRSL